MHLQTGLRFADGIFQWDPVADAHGYIVEVASTNVSGSTRRIDAERAPLTPRPADGVGYVRMWGRGMNEVPCRYSPFLRPPS